MRNNHAFFHRTHVRAWLVAVALGCLSLIVSAAPINSSNIGRLGVSGNARSTALTPGAPPVNSGGSTIPISPTTGGWTQAGNYGVPPSATGPNAGTLTASGDVVFRDSYKNGQNSWDVNGIKYPAQVSTPIPWGAVGGAAAGIVCAVASAGACAIAGAVAAASPYIIDWLGRAGLSRNSETGEVEGPDLINPPWASDAKEYLYPGTSQWYKDPNSACGDGVVLEQAANPSYTVSFLGLAGTGNQRACTFQYKLNSTGSTGNADRNLNSRGSNCPVGFYVYLGGCYSAANLPRSKYDRAQVADKLGRVTPDPRVWGEVLQKGGTIEMPNPTVTGPTSIQGPETVKQNSDGTKEVSRTTYNFTTNGNTITNTTNITTTNTYNSSNVQTGSTTTTTTPSESTPQEEPKDPCQKNPTALGCRDIDFDTPAGDIPKDTKNVTFSAETVGGSGSCPVDSYVSLASTGQTLKAWDWTATCNYFLPIRAIVMTLAAFSALLIVMPGSGRPS